MDTLPSINITDTYFLFLLSFFLFLLFRFLFHPFLLPLNTSIIN
jgi:hypothetical protein